MHKRAVLIGSGHGAQGNGVAGSDSGGRVELASEDWEAPWRETLPLGG